MGSNSYLRCWDVLRNLTHEGRGEDSTILVVCFGQRRKSSHMCGGKRYGCRLSRMKQPRCLKVFWKVLAQGKIKGLKVATTEGGWVLSLRHHIVSIVVVCFKSISGHRVIITQCSKWQPLFGWFCLCVHAAQHPLTVLSTITISPGRSGLSKVLI